MKENKKPFYKELYNKIENELGPIDTVIGITLGATVCVLYWRYAWLKH